MLDAGFSLSLRAFKFQLAFTIHHDHSTTIVVDDLSPTPNCKLGPSVYGISINPSIRTSSDVSVAKARSNVPIVRAVMIELESLDAITNSGRTSDARSRADIQL
jgi:hypothetical protein